VLAVGPTANWGGKQWPADRFAEAVRRLTAPDGMLAGARVAVFGAAAERSVAAPLLAAIPEPRCIDLVGHSDLLTAYACLERSSFYFGNDSGLMHLAAASGVPTLGLFGPSREDIYGPWGVNTATVRTRESLAEIVGQPGYDYHSAESHMGSLTVDMVAAAAERLWRRVREAA
jgi:ADP-heptose:LPS heptosyltransferase